MKTDHHLDLPRRLQIEFSHVIQRHTDNEGGEVDAHADVADLRRRVPAPGDFRVGQVQFEQRRGHRTDQRHGACIRPASTKSAGVGNGPIAAFCEALSTVDMGLGGLHVRVLDYAEHALTAGRDAEAAAYLEIEVGELVYWGVGISESIVQASLRGVLSGSEPRRPGTRIDLIQRNESDSRCGSTDLVPDETGSVGGGGPRGVDGRTHASHGSRARVPAPHPGDGRRARSAAPARRSRSICLVAPAAPRTVVHARRSRGRCRHRPLPAEEAGPPSPWRTRCTC